MLQERKKGRERERKRERERERGASSIFLHRPLPVSLYRNPEYCMTQGDAKEDRPLEYQTHTGARVLSPREPQDKPVSGCGIDLHADAPPHERHGEATGDQSGPPV